MFPNMHRNLMMIHRTVSFVMFIFIFLASLTGLLFELEIFVSGPDAAHLGRGFFAPEVHFLAKDIHTTLILGFLFGNYAVIIGFALGLTLIYLSASGIYFYVKLYRSWIKQSSSMTVSKLMTYRGMRYIHRWLTIPAAIFLLLISITGTILMYDPLDHKQIPYYTGRQAQRAIVGRRAVRAEAEAKSIPIDRLIVGQMNSDKREKEARHLPETLSLAMWHIIPPSMVKNRLLEMCYLIHTGLVIGVTGQILVIFSAFCLAILSTSGMVMYLTLYLRRSREGKKGLVWL